MRTRTVIRLDELLGLPLCLLASVLSTLARALTPRRAARPVRRILVVKFLGLGSVLLATPMLRALRRAHPEARITFLTFAPQGELLRRLPVVDEVIEVPRHGLAALFACVPGLLLRLRGARFDVALDLEFYSRLSNLVTWGSGARRRVGFFVRARWRGSLLTDEVYFNATLDYGQAVMALLKPLGIPADTAPALVAPVVSEAELEAAQRLLAARGAPTGGALVAVNVNASDLCEERRWPGERYARLVERFRSEIACVEAFVFLGAPSEVAAVREVLNAIEPGARARCIDLSGATDLIELMGVLRQCALLVTNDSGPLHLAASLGVPTISLFGPETPALYGPVGERHLVFYARHWCSPCLSVYNAKIAMCHGENECMRRITLDDVVAQAAVFCRESVGLAPPHPADRREVRA